MDPRTVTAYLTANLMLVGACASPSKTADPPQQQQLTRAVSPPDRLSAPESLPGAARLILHNRMASHAQDMGALMSAIMVLRYQEIEARAHAIEADANLARPLSGDATELNSLLPEKFFEHQDALRRQAGLLAAAAQRKDAVSVANNYGALSQTCVHCHATYRAGR